jgi:CheY-like chemotaxis protein
MVSRITNCVVHPRPIIWIVDVYRSDYDHLLTEARAEQAEIHFFSSGREFLHRWFSGAPDVCILNLQLQEFSGFDLVADRQIRARR